MSIVDDFDGIRARLNEIEGKPQYFTTEDIVVKGYERDTNGLRILRPGNGSNDTNPFLKSGNIWVRNILTSKVDQVPLDTIVQHPWYKISSDDPSHG